MLLTGVFSPLEQFLVLPIVNFSYLYFTINNILITLTIVIILISIFFFSMLNKTTTSLYLTPTKYQFFFESVFLSILAVLNDNVQSAEKKKFFPIIITIFFLF